MNKSPKRCTADPFWQVRYKSFLVTQEGYSDHHWELCCDECGSVYRSDIHGEEKAIEHIREMYPCYYKKAQEYIQDNGKMELEDFIYWNDLPEGLRKLHMQEVDEIAWTGLSEAGAKAFIERKQHDFPKLYTYVESAYWSTELKAVMDWLKSLS